MLRRWNKEYIEKMKYIICSVTETKFHVKHFAADKVCAIYFAIFRADEH